MEEPFEVTLEKTSNTLKSLRYCVLLCDFLNKFDIMGKRRIINEINSICSILMIKLHLKDGVPLYDELINCRRECDWFEGQILRKISSDKEDVTLDQVMNCFQFSLEIKEIRDIFLQLLEN